MMTLDIIRASTVQVLLACLVCVDASADTHYVDAGNATPTPPYTNWATAAATIQAAVNEAAAGDIVLVTNGHYVLSQELSLGDALTVKSVNGAEHTTLDGNDARGCLLMTDSDALVEGFTIVRGYGWTANYVLGTVKRCVIRDCYAESMNGPSGAIYLGSRGRLENCLIYNNTAKCLLPRDTTRGSAGVLSAGGTLVNCTITANTLLAGRGGGGFQSAVRKGGTVRNCILWGNSSPDGTQAAPWSRPPPLFTHCCMPTDVEYTENRIDGPPQFLNEGTGDYRLQSISPCIDSGEEQSWMISATDLGEEPRVWDGNGDDTAVPDVGAHEFVPYPPDFEDLSITAQPQLHDSPVPMDYGLHRVRTGTVVTNSVTTPADESAGTRYVCTGWTGTGDIPATGTSNVVHFTATMNSTLVWHWAAECLLDTETGVGGTVDTEDGWYSNGAPVTLEASTLAGWLFSGWTGDVPGGMATNNPLTVSMDQPRAIRANFTLPLGAIAGTVTDGGTNTGPIRVVASGTAQNHILELDGVNDVVAVPDSNELDLRDAVTLEARVWFRAIENRDYIVGRLDDDLAPAYRILVLTGGQIGFALDNARRVQGGSVTTGRWYSVAATYDGSRMRVYIDGEEEASIAATGSIDPTTWASLYMGGKHISGDTYDLELDGYLDDVRVWDRALDADEVRQYATMSPLPGAPGLVGHWDFNDGTADATTNANDGTLVGDAAIVPSDDTAAAQYASTIGAPGPYVITNVPTLAFYDVRAYRDRNGDWREDGGDPAGAYPANPVFLTNTVGGVDIELLDKLLDTDSDGLSDYDEVYLYGTNPYLGDTDGDGMDDAQELTAGTSPTNADDVFCVTECSSAGATNPLVVCWDTVTGRLYTVNGAEDLLAPSWSNLFQTVGDGSRKCFTNSGSLAPIYFIRLGVEQP